MNAIPENLSDDDIATIQGEVRRTVAEHYPSMAAAARDAGIAESTFHAFANGSYNGDNTKMAGRVRAWLSSRAERARTAATLPKAPPFQLTPTAQKILPVLTWAQVAPDFTPIIGAPGIGKTTVLDHYQRANPNVWLVTMEPCWSSVNAMLGAICSAMDLEERSATRLSDAIAKRVKGTQALIIIDEAQHLSSAALEQVRSLHDKAKVGVALCGNRTIHARLYGKGQESHGQLFSRAGMKFKQFAPLAGDICQLAAAWGVSDAAETDFLKAIARKVGALRNLDKVMKLAGMLAAGAGQARTLAHIRAAWEQIDVNLAADMS